MKSFRLAIPIISFLAISIFLYRGLFSDPSHIDNANLKRDFPEFSLPDLMDDSVIYDKSVLKQGYTLVNVWGTWCNTCIVEIPFMVKLRQQGFRIVGLYYDNAADAAFGNVDVVRTRQQVTDMLGQLGNPFEFNIYDIKRDLSLDLGVTGAPESFLVNQNGVIIAHHRGDINPQVWQDAFLPLMTVEQAAKGDAL